jgi:hypothetical protein
MTQTLSTIADGLDMQRGIEAAGGRCQFGAVTFCVVALVGRVVLGATPAIH